MLKSPRAGLGQYSSVRDSILVFGGPSFLADSIFSSRLPAPIS